MLLDRYQEKGLLFNANLRERTSAEGVYAYRGDLVLQQGEIADSQGRRKPPIVVVKEAVLLEEQDRIRFVTGFIDELEHLILFLDRYRADLAPDAAAIFFVANIARPLQVPLEAWTFRVIPLTEGMVWNALVEELGMEKSDFKGQSAADKVVTLWQAVREFRPGYESYALETALGGTIQAKRATHGAV